MKLGMVGLGKMGANMTARLLEASHELVVHDRSPEAEAASAARGARGSESIPDLVSRLDAPRVVWLMVPAGEPTETVVEELSRLLKGDDLIVDGGNSYYKDTVRRAAALKAKGISLVDVGTSGGIWGLTEGYSMMVGGDRKAVERLRPVLESLARRSTAGGGTWGLRARAISSRWSTTESSME